MVYNDPVAGASQSVAKLVETRHTGRKHRLVQLVGEDRVTTIGC